MKKFLLIILFFQTGMAMSEVDWSRTNSCEYKNFNNADLIEQLIDGMTIEEKVGQVIQGDLDFISPEDVKKFKIGFVPQHGGFFHDLTVFENLKAIAEIAIDNVSFRSEKIDLLISLIFCGPSNIMVVII